MAVAKKGILCYEVGCDTKGTPHYKHIKTIFTDVSPQFMSIPKHLPQARSSHNFIFSLFNTIE